jgi:hypothetical protein
LAEVYKKYESQGLHIIGLEAQSSAKDAIVTLCKGKGVTYQITTGGRLKGADGPGIPQGFLFGADGKFVCEVHPGQLEPKIKDLIKEVAAAMAGPGPYVKLASLATQVRSGQGLGTVLKTLRAKKDSKDEAEAKEAAMMLESLGSVAQMRLDRAMALKDSDPAECVKQLVKVGTQFTGDEIGTKARTESETMKKDPKVRKEIEGSVMYEQYEKVFETLKPFQGARDPKAEGFRKLNLDKITQIVSGCKTIVARYPDTLASKKATEMMDQFR